MKFLLFALIFFANQSWATSNLIEQAHELYDAGEKEQALELYLEAATKGDADGHFYAAYRYTLPNDENTHHFIEAAQQGHAKALEYALDKLFFRANSLTKADPEKALAVYHQAKQKNPNLRIYDEDNKYKTLEKCVEAGKLDISRFKTQEAQEREEIYSIWEMAEDAANTNRFGKPNAHLALQLVCYGGWVPAEVESAVAELYQTWKTENAPHFNFCDHVTSRTGMAFCQYRSDK
jgi:hypothetical protein